MSAASSGAETTTAAPEGAKRARLASGALAPGDSISLEIGARLLITVDWSRELAERFGIDEIPSRWTVTQVGVPLAPDEWGYDVFGGLAKPDFFCRLEHRNVAGISYAGATVRAGKMVSFCFGVDRNNHGVGVVLVDGKWKMTFGDGSVVGATSTGKNPLDDMIVHVNSW